VEDIYPKGGGFVVQRLRGSHYRLDGIREQEDAVVDFREAVDRIVIGGGEEGVAPIPCDLSGEKPREA
jgi:hypothetical protein